MNNKSIDDAIDNVMKAVDNMFTTVTATITNSVNEVASTKKKKKLNTVSAAELKLLREKAEVLDYIAQFNTNLKIASELAKWYPIGTKPSNEPTHIKPFT